MKKTVLVFLAGLILWGMSGFGWAQCPQDPNDNGICDTLYVETFPPDKIFDYPAPDFVRVPIYVTHDVPDPAVDSIAGFVIPLCFRCTNTSAYCSLTSWWNNTDLYPFPTIDRSIFRHLVSGNDTTRNWMMTLSEQLMGLDWDTRILILDGTSHFWLGLIPTGSPDQKFEEGSRVLLATMTFKLEDTTTICIDSCFWPPAGRLAFSRSDAVNYIPRIWDDYYGIEEVCDTIYSGGPLPGVSFSQVDFIFDCAGINDTTQLDSDWGRLEVDALELLSHSGLSDGYLNVRTDSGWVITNMIVDTADGDFCVTYFDLFVDPGTDVTSLSVHVEFTSYPSEYFPDGDRISYPVGFFSYSAKDGNREEPAKGIPSPPKPAQPVPEGETFKTVFKNQPGHNVQTACNQCAPMAVANSLQWLEDTYPGINVPHPHNPSDGYDETLVGQLDECMERRRASDPTQPPTRTDGKGVGVRQILDGKFKYLRDNGLANDLIHEHQGNGLETNPADPDPDQIPDGDYTNHGITSKDTRKPGTTTSWEWIYEQIEKGEDVEVSYCWEDEHGNWAGSHTVRVFGAGKTKGKAWIKYKHDAAQTDIDPTDTEGLEEVEEEVSDIDGDGLANLGGRADREISFALSESPRPRKWIYHPRLVNGDLTVYGTVDCVPREDPLFSGYVTKCRKYSGSVPEWANDLLAIFAWDADCGNVNWMKVAAPESEGGVWELPPLDDWLRVNLPPGFRLELASIGDSTGVIQNVYVMINPADWLANPRPHQQSYDVVDGECDDLPGYMIGTTPITFDSLAPPGDWRNAFATTPLTGTLVWDGELIFAPDTIPPCDTCHLFHDTAEPAYYYGNWNVGDQQAIYYDPVTMCMGCSTSYPLLLTHVEGAFYDFVGVGSVDVIWHFYEAGDQCDGPGAEIHSFPTTVTTFYPDMYRTALFQDLCLEDDFFLAVEYNSGTAGEIPSLLMTDETPDTCMMFNWYGEYSPPWWEWYDFWSPPVPGYLMLRAQGRCNLDSCVIICGDCTGDAAVAAGDVVYLISYLFRGGPSPAPICVGDVNCSGAVEAGDVVYLITYLFRGGPPPGPDCCAGKMGAQKTIRDESTREPGKIQAVPQRLPGVPRDLERMR